MALPTDPAALTERALAGDRRALARLVSVVESDGEPAARVLARLFPRTGRAAVTGVTGAPGAGKSTLTDHLIGCARPGGEVAVLAVDPSSPFTGGAILGDRLRMQRHVDDGGVYIRSLASRGSLGGLSEATPRALAILDAVGFPELFVETVGVGQAEVEITASADTTIVVVTPGWGDSVQTAKAGLLEIGDVFVVNKADRPGVDETVRDLAQMLDLGGHRDWRPPIVTTVATTGDGVAELWAAVGEHRVHLGGMGRLEEVRMARMRDDLERALYAEIGRRMRRHVPPERFEAELAEVVARRIDPWSAAARLLAE